MLTSPRLHSAGTIPKHPQQLFFDNVNPATRLLEKRRQMYEVQDALENQKARFAKEEEQFRKKEEQLRDNEAKRRRSETRAHEEAAQIKLKDEEIQDLEKQLQDSKFLCTKLEEEKDRNMKYEETAPIAFSQTQDIRCFGSRVVIAISAMQTIKVESAKDQMLRDFSQTLLQEIHKIAEQLQESFREELRNTAPDQYRRFCQDRHAAQFFRGSECVSKATTERGPARPQLKQARSFHFSPHVWATRHIRRYRQSEDEDEEDTEGEELRVKSTKSRVPSRPSTAASRPRVSFALSKQSSCDLRAVASSPHPHRPVVLLGQDGRNLVETRLKTPIDTLRPKPAESHKGCI
eukprot:g13013.t1